MGLGGKVRRKEKKAREERKEDGMSDAYPLVELTALAMAAILVVV